MVLIGSRQPTVDSRQLGWLLSALVLLAPSLGIGRDAPEWSWIAGVLLVDVAHVWSTSFVVYLDPVEWRRRPMLYALTPLAMFGVGVALYAWGPDAFWRAIGMLAVCLTGLGIPAAAVLLQAEKQLVLLLAGKQVVLLQAEKQLHDISMPSMRSVARPSCAAWRCQFLPGGKPRLHGT